MVIVSLHAMRCMGSMVLWRLLSCLRALSVCRVVILRGSAVLCRRLPHSGHLLVVHVRRGSALAFRRRVVSVVRISL